MDRQFDHSDVPVGSRRFRSERRHFLLLDFRLVDRRRSLLDFLHSDFAVARHRFELRLRSTSRSAAEQSDSSDDGNRFRHANLGEKVSTRTEEFFRAARSSGDFRRRLSADADLRFRSDRWRSVGISALLQRRSTRVPDDSARRHLSNEPLDPQNSHSETSILHPDDELTRTCSTWSGYSQGFDACLYLDRRTFTSSSDSSGRCAKVLRQIHQFLSQLTVATTD